MNILISSAGRRVSLVKAFRSELNNLNPSAKVFAVDHKPELSAACQQVDGYYKVPKLHHPDYIKELLKICEEHSVQLLIPTIDTELLLLSRNRAAFEKIGTNVVISSEAFIENCRNKRKVHKFFAEHGIDSAKEISKTEPVFPLFIKPIDGSGGQNTLAIYEEESLLRRYIEDDNLMFLEYYEPKKYDEYTCDLYYDKTGVLRCIIPRKRLEVREGEVSKALTLRNEVVPFIKQRLSKIEGAKGCVTFQLFKHKEKKEFIGIEINPRFGGGYPLSYLAGANFPKWIIAEYLKEESIDDQFECWEENMLMLRYDAEVLIHGYKD